MLVIKCSAVHWTIEQTSDWWGWRKKRWYNKDAETSPRAKSSPLRPDLQIQIMKMDISCGTVRCSCQYSCSARALGLLPIDRRPWWSLTQVRFIWVEQCLRMAVLPKSPGYIRKWLANTESAEVPLCAQALIGKPCWWVTRFVALLVDPGDYLRVHPNWTG